MQIVFLGISKEERSLFSGGSKFFSYEKRTQAYNTDLAGRRHFVRDGDLMFIP